MVYCRTVSSRAAMDSARGARSGFAPHCRRMLWRGNVSAGRGRLPVSGVGGEDFVEETLVKYIARRTGQQSINLDHFHSGLEIADIYQADRAGKDPDGLDHHAQ